MARPLRFAFEGACYHIISRGNRKEDIFLSDKDNEIFIEKMNETFKKYSIICYAYCLMKNHYHIFLKTNLPNISSAIHYLNSSYANWFKKKYDLKGPLFQGRYKSFIVEEENYSLNLATYIHLNPIRANIVKNLNDYKWSSYLDYIGEREKLVHNLDISKILNYFGNNLKESIEGYKEYLLKNYDMENPCNDAYGGFILGGKEFIKKIIKLGKDKKIDLRDYSEKKFFKEKKWEDIVSEVSKVLGIKKEKIFEKKRGNVGRNISIYLIKKYTSLSLKDIGEIFNMDYSAVSQSAKRVKKDKKIEKKLKIIENFIEEMSNVET